MHELEGISLPSSIVGRRNTRQLRGLGLLALFGLALTFGCAKPQPQTPKATTAVELPLERPFVGDEQFAGAALEVLLHGATTPEQLALLVGVVQHQLHRAENLFEAGQEQAGIRACLGGLFLIRLGDFRSEMLATADASLLRAATQVSRLGREGQALALYSLLARHTTSGDWRREAEEHLQALADWHRASASSGALQAAGDWQRVAAERAMLEPSEEAFRSARDATRTWIKKALDYRDDQGQNPPRSMEEREEIFEAFRATRSGAWALAALHLRHGDAAGALSSVQQQDVAPVVAPSLREQLALAAEADEPEAWAALFSMFESLQAHAAEGTGVDSTLAAGASWGAAIELFRSKPDNIRATVPIASLLLRHEMGEVATLIFKQSLQPSAGTQELNWALEYVGEAITRAADTGDLIAARRVFEYATPVLDIARARSQNAESELSPAPEQLDLLMGAIEVRSGHLEQARVHLIRAIAVTPSAEALSLLASIERQRSDFASALKSLEGVIALSRKDKDLTAEAEAQLLHFEVQRDAGNAASASEDLRAALATTLTAREQARTLRSQAEAERLLARVLEHYGDQRAANRAAERALEASRGNSRQLTATLLDSSRRALTHGNLHMGRESVRRAMEEDLPPEDLVYTILWLSLLEQRLGATSDGTVEEALAQLELTAGGWPSKLKAWAKRELDGTGLLKQAGNPIELVEAQFYVAMASSRSAEELQRELRQIASSSAIQLVEVTIARDLIAPHLADLKLPPDVAVP